MRFSCLRKSRYPCTVREQRCWWSPPTWQLTQLNYIENMLLGWLGELKRFVCRTMRIKAPIKANSHKDVAKAWSLSRSLGPYGYMTHTEFIESWIGFVTMNVANLPVSVSSCNKTQSTISLMKSVWVSPVFFCCELLKRKSPLDVPQTIGGSETAWELCRNLYLWHLPQAHWATCYHM